MKQFPDNYYFLLTNGKEVCGKDMICPVCGERFLVKNRVQNGTMEDSVRDPYLLGIAERWRVNMTRTRQVETISFTCPHECVSGEMNIKSFRIDGQLSY